MKSILNSALVLTLLMSPVVMLANDEQIPFDVLVQSGATQADFNNGTSAPFVTDVTKSRFGRTVDTVKSAGSSVKSNAVSAGSYVVAKAKNAGSSVATSAKSAGSYVATKAQDFGSSVKASAISAKNRGMDLATSAKNYVANEYNNAQGVKGVSLFVGKAALATGVVVGGSYLLYKGATLAKPYVTKAVNNVKSAFRRAKARMTGKKLITRKYVKRAKAKRAEAKTVKA